MIERNLLYNEDCLKVLPQLEDGSIDLIVTDPPYRTRSGASPNMGGYWNTDKLKNGKIFEFNDTDIADYIGEFYRVLKETAHCYIMCNNRNLPHFFDVISKSPFRFTRLLVWDKGNKICGTYYMTQMEFIFFLRKGKDRPINDCSCGDLLRFSNFNRERNKDGTNLHDSIKPVSLMQCLIENSSNAGEIVLDPFMGSGSTIIAAIRAKRDYIGIEIDPKFYEVAKKRIESDSKILTLF